MFCCQDPDEVQSIEKPNRRNTRCTDVPFAIVFVLFLFGLGGIAFYAFNIGSPFRLIHGSDSFGNICGQRNVKIDNLPFTGLDMTKRPNLFHLNQRDPKNSIKICVKKCPNRDLVNMAEIYQFYTRYNSSLCRYDFEFNASIPTASPLFQDSQLYPTLDQLQEQPKANDTGLCPTLPVFRNRRLLYYCVPEMAIIQGVALGHSLYDYMSGRFSLKKIVGDIINSHEEMIIMGAVAIVSSVITVFCIHFVASLASWLILVIISALLLSLTLILWWIYFIARNREKLPDKLAKLLPEDSENDTILLTFAIICTIVTLVIIYAAASMRTHVKFVVALFHETAACIRSMPGLLFQPLWTLSALIAFLTLWLFILMALATSDHQSRDQRMLQTTTTDKDLLSVGTELKNKLTSFTLIGYRDSSWIQFMWWYLLLAFVWIAEFFCSCQQLIIAGAVSRWYFTHDRENLGFPILDATCDLVCCHLGSVALGSFLITLLKLPRLIIQQTTARLKQFDNYALARKALQACACCLWIVEKFLSYLTRNAYTMVVLKQMNFCISARLAFQTLFSNALRVAAINSIGDFILLLGKLIVASLTAIVGVFLIRTNTAVHYWMIPVIIMSVFAFWIAHCLLSVYEMVIDAMFLCFCHDMNQNDGSPGKEYYAPDSLMKFLREDEQTMSEIRPNQAVPTTTDDIDEVKKIQPESQQQEGLYPDLDDYQTIRE